MKYKTVTFTASVPDDWYEKCDACKEEEKQSTCESCDRKDRSICTESKGFLIPQYPGVKIHSWSVSDERGMQHDFSEFLEGVGTTATEAHPQAKIQEDANKI